MKTWHYKYFDHSGKAIFGKLESDSMYDAKKEIEDFDGFSSHGYIGLSDLGKTHPTERPPLRSSHADQKINAGPDKLSQPNSTNREPAQQQIEQEPSRQESSVDLVTRSALASASQKYLEKIRNSTGYPVYRRVINVITIINYLVSVILVIMGLVMTIQNSSDSVITGIGLIVTGFFLFFVIVPFQKEVALMFVDLVDSTLEKNSRL